MLFFFKSLLIIAGKTLSQLPHSRLLLSSQDVLTASTTNPAATKRAPPNPMRWSVRRSWRCAQPSSASSPTWTPKPCWEPPRSAGTGGSWPVTLRCGPECCWRTLAFLPRCVIPSSLYMRLCSLPEGFTKQQDEVRWATLPFFSTTKVIYPIILCFSLQFLSILSQWCTQTHSLILQNLKPRQRGKKESKEDYLKSTRWDFSCRMGDGGRAAIKLHRMIVVSGAKSN